MATQRNRDRQGDEREQQERAEQRALRREREGDQQDRAELAHRAGREQERAEAGLDLAGVVEDRDQRPDGGGGHRRAHVEQGHDDAGPGEEAADRVGEHERQQPPRHDRELERHALDPVELDLVAREEEQHAEAEIREELDELVRLREVEDLGPDDDAEHQLDHHDRAARGSGWIIPASSAATAATLTTTRNESASTVIMRAGIVTAQAEHDCGAGDILHLSGGHCANVPRLL